MLGAPEQEVLLGTNAGYGFVTTLGALEVRNKAGKAMLTVPPGMRALSPATLAAPDDEIACVTTAGHLLVFKAANLPRLPRGKGLKMISIPAGKARDGAELVRAAVVLPANASLRLLAGNRHLSLRGRDLDAYRGERARRGNRLPRGFQRVDAMEVMLPGSA
jgi:topoisomerase-4 subunit A